MTPFRIRNKAAFNYARSVIDTYSRNFTVSSRLLPRQRRWAVYAMYGFCRYAYNLIDQSRMRTRDETSHDIDSLRQELILAYRTGESEHPVMISFIEVASHFQIPLEYPLEFLKGVSMDAEQRRFQTYDELQLFCRRVAGVLGMMLTHVLGFRSKAAFPYAEKLGVAMQLTNILRDIQEDWKTGRLYLPHDEMLAHSVSESMFTDREINPNLAALIEKQTARAHQYYREARPGIALLDRDSQFAIRCAARVYEQILYQLEDGGFNPFSMNYHVKPADKIKIVAAEWIRKERQ